MLREMIGRDHLPDYQLEEEPGDILRVTPRRDPAALGDAPRLAAETLETARGLAPGWDVHALESEWKTWWASTGRPRLRAPDKAFLGWVRKRLG